MNTGYLIYQAERPRSGAEQRTVDAYAGQLAASFARRVRSLTAPLRALLREHADHERDPDATATRELTSCG